MKAALIVSLAAGLAAAESTGELPACAKNCVEQVLRSGGSISNCQSADFKCFCSNKAFINDIVCCINKTNACTMDQLQETLKYAITLCSTVGVEIPNSVPTCSAQAPTPTPRVGSNSTSNSTDSSSSSTAGAAVAGSVGGFAGAVLAMLAAL